MFWSDRHQLVSPVAVLKLFQNIKKSWVDLMPEVGREGGTWFFIEKLKADEDEGGVLKSWKFFPFCTSQNVHLVLRKNWILI